MLSCDQISQGKYGSFYKILKALTNLDKKPLRCFETTLDLFSLITFYIYSWLMVTDQK